MYFDRLLHFFLTDYELADESRMYPKIEQKSELKSSQSLGSSQLVMISPRTRAKDTHSNRKLPRTPDEYAELRRKTCNAEPSRRVNSDMALRTTRQSVSNDSMYMPFSSAYMVYFSSLCYVDINTRHLHLSSTLENTI